MPLGLFAMLLMPFGYENLALIPMALSVDYILIIAESVNQSSDILITGNLPQAFLITGTIFLLSACFLSSKLRLLSIIPLGATAFFAFEKQSAPDFIISQDGRTIGIISAQNSDENNTRQKRVQTLTFAYPKRNKFIQNIWAKAYTKGSVANHDQARFNCGKDICRFSTKGKKVAVIYNPELIKQACHTEDILIAPRLWWVRCKKHSDATRSTKMEIFKRLDFETKGSHAFWIDKNNPDKLKVKMAWTDNLYKEEIDQKIDKIVSSAQLVGKGYFTQFLSLSEDSRRPWQQRFLLPKRKQQRPSLMHSESLKEQSLDKKTKG